MSFLNLLQTNVDGSNTKEIVKQCKKFSKSELEELMGGIAPPLILAIYFSCKEAVKELLKRGSNVNQLSNDGSSALLWAFVKKDRDIIDMLIKKKPDFTIKNNTGKTPLYTLCSNLNSVKYLKYAIKQIGESGFRRECRDSCDTTETLLSSCIECITNYRDEKEVLDLIAAQQEIFDKMDILIEYGSDIKHKIVLSGKEYSLLDFIDNNQLFRHFPTIAENLVIYFLDRGLNGRNCGKDTAILYTAAQYGNFNAVKLLTENDYDVNVQISNKCTPLIVALENDKFEISRYLIKHGSNVNHSMNDGTSAIFYAMNNGNNDFVREILHLIDTKKTFPEPIELRRVRLPAHYNILHMACETENYDIISDLIASGMDMNEKGRCAVTPAQLLEDKDLNPVILDFLTRPYSDYKDYAKNKRNNKIFDDEDCPICLTPMYEDITVLKCKHVFNTSCILQYLSKGNNFKCPVCRAPIELSYKVKLPEKLVRKKSLSPLSRREIKRARSVPVQSRRPVSIPTSLPSPSISDEKEDLFKKSRSRKRRGSLNNINKMRKRYSAKKRSASRSN